MSGAVALLVLAAVWVATSVAGGALLAGLATRIHSGLSFARLWIVYTALLAFTVAAVMAIAWW
jgi:hypothetical protein